jgi:hypothetical protein
MRNCKIDHRRLFGKCRVRQNFRSDHLEYCRRRSLSELQQITADILGCDGKPSAGVVQRFADNIESQAGVIVGLAEMGQNDMAQSVMMQLF